MKHIKVGAQNDRLLVKRRPMYTTMTFDGRVRNQAPTIDNSTRREMYFFVFSTRAAQMASKHRQVGAQNPRLDVTNRSVYIQTVSVLRGKKPCVFERRGAILRKSANLETPVIQFKVGCSTLIFTQPSQDCSTSLSPTERKISSSSTSRF